MLLNCLLVGAGGFVGSIARYLLGLLSVTDTAAGSFPVATFGVNVAGAFLIGFVMALFTKGTGMSPQLLLFLKVGMCGGFTTFSTFSLESLSLIESGHVGMAAVYMAASVAACLVSVALGSWVAR
ncbi:MULTISPECIES: fluoride efflux transporter CrcB [unclassified Adlercreutzia]|uniref:fluoride efflux transporter CrcB n=1 Tax=unclassified Adlercreutzia TaxID=2636013 RepID=UPI001F14D913|nr:MULTISPECIES: fluoride efflux transporter CrcB [unclassified Adlercreutzia]